MKFLKFVVKNGLKSNFENINFLMHSSEVVTSVRGSLNFAEWKHKGQQRETNAVKSKKKKKRNIVDGVRKQE